MNLSRRGFLKLLGAAATGAALESAIPLGRKWFFPKQFLWEDINQITLKHYHASVDILFQDRPVFARLMASSPRHNVKIVNVTTPELIVDPFKDRWIEEVHCVTEEIILPKWEIEKIWPGAILINP